jgi:hypothetical protein
MKDEFKIVGLAAAGCFWDYVAGAQLDWCDRGTCAGLSSRSCPTASIMTPAHGSRFNKCKYRTGQQARHLWAG